MITVLMKITCSEALVSMFLAHVNLRVSDMWIMLLPDRAMTFDLESRGAQNTSEEDATCLGVLETGSSY